MAVTLFFCEAAGARLIATNAGLTQTGVDFQGDITTWDLTPSGEVGDNLLRSIDVSGSCTNGYSMGVTPIVDGVNQAEQTFSGSGTGEFVCQAFCAVRGARFAARVRTITRTGDIEIHNIAMAFLPVRRVP